MSRTGSISVKTQDIFPIIKKWLYSEHDIFLRELVSNACDAITKRHAFARTENTEAPEGKVEVIVNKSAGTVTLKDNGVGMTEEEVEKYLAQLAFSGAAEFVEKMKAQGQEADVIGKFGLGFYSAFMVADTVTVDSLSYKAGSKAVKWTCSGDVDYTFDEGERTEAGTTITLKISKESEDFLNHWKISETLRRYCDFMPWDVSILDAEAKDAKADVINEKLPLWKKDAASITDQEYKDFYRKLFPMDPEPLFWLHLNVDHPFTLQGILYFPKVNMQKPIQDHGIKLYCKQVFVSDNVKNVLPEFLSLLKGAMDSTDIPLNVSRSALQGDPNVKKISNYVIKKVAEGIKKLANSDRARYEQVWEDISLFVKYGCVSDTKFDEIAQAYVLFKNSENKLVTLDEYKTAIPETYKEKMKEMVLTHDAQTGDESLRKQLLAVGVHAITLDQMIDPHFTQHAEMHSKDEKKIKFSTVETEIENLLESDPVSADDVKIGDFFKEALAAKPEELDVEVKGLKNSTSAGYFKVDEQMRRFQQMTKSMGQNFNMPLKKTLVINPNHPMVQNAWKMWESDKKDLAKKLVTHVQDLATLSSEGLTLDNKEAFVARSQALVQELSSLALH
ncbi:MAG: molecular chaperone HtpG [Bacteriovoracaceae bacterium]|nr:molecular chaperone HtpG [Bacteriovoracaceae bacterium]